MLLDGAWLLLYDTSLSGGLFDELIVVVNDALEIICAIIEFPQLLVNGCLVVQYVDDELFIDIFAWAGGIL